MLDVKIKYDEPTSSWGTQFKEALDENGIIYDEQMILNICRSLDNTVCDFLYANGYKPRPNLSYRVGLIKRLRKNGLTLSITTNYVFWKYLEYFTDITDYSKCFNIKITTQKTVRQFHSYFNSEAFKVSSCLDFCESVFHRLI